MTAWTGDELDRLGGAQGAGSGWHRVARTSREARIRAGDVEKDVRIDLTVGTGMLALAPAGGLIIWPRAARGRVADKAPATPPVPATRAPHRRIAAPLAERADG